MLASRPSILSNETSRTSQNALLIESSSCLGIFEQRARLEMGDERSMWTYPVVGGSAANVAVLRWELGKPSS